MKETLVRAHAYAMADADGIFVLGVLDPETVRTLVDSVPVPVNVLVGLGARPVSELAAAGAARISAGSSIAEAAYGLAARATRKLLTQGATSAMEGGLDYATLTPCSWQAPHAERASGTQPNPDHRGGVPGGRGPHGRVRDGGMAGGGPPNEAAERCARHRSGCPGDDVRDLRPAGKCH
jgi:hypothetical protein